MERRWLTAKEAAEYLRLHLKTIYRLVSMGAIPYSKISGYGIRIDKVELDRLLEENEHYPKDLGSILDGEKARK